MDGRAKTVERRRRGGLILLVLAACGGSAGKPPSAPGGDPGGDPGGGDQIVLPTADARFDYQIGQSYAPAADIAIVDRDWHEAPAPGKYNVCYVNGFQTQPEENGWWRSNHPDLILVIGKTEVEDPGWPGELILDLTTAEKRVAIADIVGGWMATCKSKGYQAVEPDNLDSWTRSRGRFGQVEGQALATLLAARAHAQHLAIAQKNAGELAPSRAQIGFDFAIVEECQPYGDCGAFDAAYGHRWFEIEYTDEGSDGGRGNFEAACSARGATTEIILRDRDVTAPGAPGYHFQHC